MDKQNLVYTCKGILFNLNSKWNAGACCNVDEPLNMLSEMDTKGQILYDSMYMSSLEKFTETVQ